MKSAKSAKTSTKTASKAKAVAKTAGKAAPKSKAIKPKVAAKPKAAAKPKTASKKRSAADAGIANTNIQRPVRNRTAYMMFVKDNRTTTQDAHPEMGFVEITKHIAEQWGKLSAAEKKPYEDRAAADKVRYEREVAIFREAHPGEPLTIKKKKRTPKLKGPKKARSAYVFYTKAERDAVQRANPNADFGEVTKQIAQSWNALGASGRAKYEKMAAEDRTRFESENAQFNADHPEVRRRKMKAKKSAPKKARSAYLFYTMEKRASFKSANPDKDFGGLTKLVADDWKKLTPAQRKKYDKLAEEDRKRYDGEMKVYVRPTDAELDAMEPARKQKREGPKRPRSAYLFYTTAERKKLASEDHGMKFVEVTQRIAGTWKELSARERSKYEEMAKADQERYKRECAAVSK